MFAWKAVAPPPLIPAHSASKTRVNALSAGNPELLARDWQSGSPLQAAVTCASDPGRALMRAGVLAPDSERFLRRTVGDREQHRFLSWGGGVMLPRRPHEHVVRAPFQHLAVDRGGALPFGADENGAVGGAVFLALEALGEEREVRAHGRQHRPAVD